MQKEKKDTVTSLRWSSSDCDLAEKNAKARGMSRNAYIAMAVRHAEEMTTAEMKVRVQSAVNDAVTAFQNGEKNAMKNLLKEMDKLW